MKLEKDLLSFRKGFSGKELVLLAGGLFLLYKSSKRYITKWRENPETKAKKSRLPVSDRS
jgi:hypothetical protein